MLFFKLKIETDTLKASEVGVLFFKIKINTVTLKAREVGV